MAGGKRTLNFSRKVSEVGTSRRWEGGRKASRNRGVSDGASENGMMLGAFVFGRMTVGASRCRYGGRSERVAGRRRRTKSGSGKIRTCA